MPRHLEDLTTALAAKARAVRFEDGGRFGARRCAARTVALTSQGGAQALGREAWLQPWRSQCSLL
eukprot:7182896-Pyramimonas_sp.AAC.1